MDKVSATTESQDPTNFDGPFEGPEKLLEVWFTPSADDLPQSHRRGLRTIPRSSWEALLERVGCQVLSVMTPAQGSVEAYLLSESSMFIFPHKLILKTCGRTTLLVGLEKLLQLVKDEAGIPSVFRVFYSRKTFMNPHLQKPPHRDWKDEVEYLDQHFLDGSAYVVGKMNGDHWLLWMTNPPPHQRQVERLPQNGLDARPIGRTEVQDETLEILMSDLDPDAMKPFFAGSGGGGGAGHEAGSALSAQVGLSSLFKNASLDSYLFTPCGYSANGILADHYFTVHVTPEPDCSYASFECNVTWTKSQIEKRDDGKAAQNVEELIGRVLDIFRPGHFSLTRFISQDGPLATKKVWIPEIADYRRTDRIVYEFDGYELVFGSWQRRQNRVL